MSKYTIRHYDMLAALESVAIGGKKVNHKIVWTFNGKCAMEFDTEEQAQAVINFIADVVDYELAENLYVSE